MLFDLVMLLNYAGQPLMQKDERKLVRYYHTTLKQERKLLGLGPTQGEIQWNRFMLYYDFTAVMRDATHAGNMTEYVHRGLDALMALIDPNETGIHPWANADERTTRKLAEGLQSRYCMNMLSACDRRIGGAPRFSDAKQSPHEYLSKEHMERMGVFYRVAAKISRTSPRSRPL